MTVDLTKHTAYGGLDLASSRDLTAFVLAWPVDDLLYVHPWFWIPEDGLVERSRRDNVRYDVWADQGHIELTPGNITDWRFVTERIRNLREKYQIADIGFDRWGARDITADLSGEGFSVVDVGQGYATMNAPCRRLEELVLSRRIRHNGHPVLRWNLDCCSVATDPGGNIKPVKIDRMRTNKRIDGLSALLDAITVWMAAENVEPAVWAL